MAYAADQSVTSDLVKVAVSGAVYVGPTTALAPTTAVEALDSDFLSVGYISEDGVVEAHTQDVNEITAWQNADVVRKTITRSEVTYQFTMIETNASSLSLFYSKAIAGAATNHVIGGGSLSRVSLVIDIVDQGKVIRRYLPSAEVSERGEVTLSNSEALGYNVTVTAYPDSSIGGSVKVLYETPIAAGLSDPTV